MISDSAPTGGQLETGYHLTSVGFGPTRTCTPPNTEATSIKEFTASSKFGTCYYETSLLRTPLGPHIHIVLIKEVSLFQRSLVERFHCIISLHKQLPLFYRSGLGKDSRTQPGEPNSSTEPVEEKSLDQPIKNGNILLVVFDSITLYCCNMYVI